ncbi:hypothetical protein [Allokutzneria oryzae]|uniref:PPE domain-containing protein n=1 Tax=Allokutzneria oryzae TaxID=1378989 RepID=A0ABV5ZRD0_9PSEU
MFTRVVAGEARPAGWDAETIYNWFHKHRGPQPTYSAAEAVLKQIIDKHDKVNEILKKGIEESRAVWTGQAADAARGGISPMVAWADQVKQVADNAQGQITAMRDGYLRAKNEVEPPRPTPDPKNVSFGFMGSGAADFVKEMQRWQANQVHNIRVVEGYGSNTNTAVQTLPQFGAPDGVDGAVKPAEQPPRDPGGPPIGQPRDPRGGGGRGGGVVGHGGSEQGSEQGSAHGGEQGGEQGGRSESAAFEPPRPGQSGQGGPLPWQPEPGAQGGTGQGGFTGAVGGPGFGGAGVGGGAGGGAGGRAGGLGGRSGTGGAPGSGAGQGGRGGVGESSRGVTGAASVARAPGKPGMPMAGPMAGGQANKTEDDEHQRPSWLVEVDDVFTNDMQKVAPPVIGEEC